MARGGAPYHGLVNAPPVSAVDDTELQRALENLDAPAWRAKQVRRALWHSPAADWEDVRQLPESLRRQLPQHLAFSSVDSALETVADAGRTIKLLCRLGDGQTVETVAMETPAGDLARRRATVCVSTQVGCAVGCPFCATGRLGLLRSCSAAEIVDQVRVASWALRRRGLGPVTHVVYMGMGEPLANAEATLQSLAVLVRDAGISARRITVSTSGVVAGIERLTREAPPVTLAVSLHAATDRLRDRLVPLNRTQPLRALRDAARRYAERSGRRITYEWCLIAGVNDSVEQARALRRVAWEDHAHVNVIPMNRITGSPWGPPDATAARAFLEALRGVRVTMRDTRGESADAACGQLRAELESRRRLRADGTLTPPRRAGND